MVSQKLGYIFTEEDVTIIIHCCNLYHRMGSGIAGVIAKKCPEAVVADQATVKGDARKLGSFSAAKSEIEGRPVTIVNLYGQMGIGCDGDPLNRNAQYDSLYNGLLKFKRSLEKQITRKKDNGEDPKVVVGIPYGLASDLAGGSWTVVRAIIDSIFNDASFDVVIVKLPTARELK